MEGSGESEFRARRTVSLVRKKLEDITVSLSTVQERGWVFEGSGLVLATNRGGEASFVSGILTCR